jgi:DNA-binding CsgD family transcriptional regulator
MISEGTLLRAADRLTNYIEQYVQLAGAEKRNEVLTLFEGMHTIFPHWVIMTCPVMHPDINYVSGNCSPVFGYDDEYIKLNTNVERFFSFVHEDDREPLHECFNFAHDQLESVPSETHHKYRTVYHYRFRKPNGQYIYLHDEKATLLLNGSGNLYYSLFRDATTYKVFKGVKVELFKQEQTLSKIEEYKPGATNSKLSKRENELVQLIRQGLSTKEIAWYLNISHNTVRNIKSKLFEKFNVNNSVELLNITA